MADEGVYDLALGNAGSAMIERFGAHKTAMLEFRGVGPRKVRRHT